MTAAPALERNPGDRSPAAGLRAELQLASVASGLLLLLDAHRLTGRLPFEIQVQVGRLRHAVKLAIHVQAGRPTPAPTPAAVDPGAALRAWIAAQPWAQPGPQGWVYLLCFRDPATGEHRPLQGNGVPGAVRQPLHREAREFGISEGGLAGWWRGVRRTRRGGQLLLSHRAAAGPRRSSCRPGRPW